MDTLYPLLAAYLFLFILLAWKNYSLALAVFIVGLPTYLVRLALGPLPTTVLELSFGILFVVWLIRFARADQMRITRTIAHNKVLFSCFFVFLFFSFVSIFTAVDRVAALGVWRAFFLEPALLFIILFGRYSDLMEKIVVWSLVASSLPVSLLAIVQKFTGEFFPPSLYGTYLFGRVTSFFTAANAVGLYLEILFFLNIYLLAQAWTAKQKKSIFMLAFCLLASATAIYFSQSVGTWLGLAAGLCVLLFLLGYKKLIAAVLAMCLVLALLVPPVHAILLSKDKSSGNRITLWHYSWDYLSASPAHFIFGTGLRSFFPRIQEPHYDDRKMEALTYPHNIFLNFWTETGLFGMLSFAGIIYFLFRISYFTFKHSNRLLGAVLLAALAALFVHGLIDVPYFKNDLAMMFWILAAFIVASSDNYVHTS